MSLQKTPQLVQEVQAWLLKSLFLVLGTCKTSAKKLFLDHGTRISEDTDNLERVEGLIKKKTLKGLQKAVNECKLQWLWLREGAQNNSLQIPYKNDSDQLFSASSIREKS